MLIALFLGALACANSAAPPSLPTPEDFTHHALVIDDGEQVYWHLDRYEIEAPGPLILFLAGSGAAPLFQSYSDGGLGFGISIELLTFMDRAHIMVVDKPGVPFAAETAWDDEKGRPVFNPEPAFAAMTRGQLVNRNAAALRAAMAQIGDRVTQVVLIGYSEGGQFVFELARNLPETTHAVAIAGNALPQWYDMVLEARLAAERGEIDRAEAQRRIDALYETITKIDADPESGESWYGHDYRRWASFGHYAPIDDMLALDIPLLMVQGGADENAPILNTDFAKIAFLGAGTTNLDYWVYPEFDHFLTESAPDDGGERVNHAQDVYDRIWAWIQETDKAD